MKISIIISVLNGSKYIEEVIKSILNQNDENFELIIIDGGSNDGTIEIIRNFNSPKIKKRFDKKIFAFQNVFTTSGVVYLQRVFC